MFVITLDTKSFKVLLCPHFGLSPWLWEFPMYCSSNKVYVFHLSQLKSMVIILVAYSYGNRLWGREMFPVLIQSHPLEHAVDLGCTPQRGMNFTIFLSLLQGRVPHPPSKACQRPPCIRYECRGSNEIPTETSTKEVWDQMVKELLKNMGKQGGDLEIQYFSKSEMICFVHDNLARECAKLVLTMC